MLLHREGTLKDSFFMVFRSCWLGVFFQQREEFAGFCVELILGDFYIAEEFRTVGSVSGDLADQMLGHTGSQ